MKNLTTNMMIAAAALVVTAGMAKAQVIKAEVPFSFKASGAVMPAGEYRVERLLSQGGANVIKVTNMDANRSILAAPILKEEKPAGDPTLTFECSAGHCALVKVDSGSGQAYRFSNPKHDEDTRVAVIRAILVK